MRKYVTLGYEEEYGITFQEENIFDTQEEAALCAAEIFIDMEIGMLCDELSDNEFSVLEDPVGEAAKRGIIKSKEEFLSRYEKRDKRKRYDYDYYSQIAQECGNYVGVAEKLINEGRVYSQFDPAEYMAVGRLSY